MRLSVLRVCAAAVIALGIALAGSSTANAESIMKECGSEWQAAKAAGTTNGQTWQEFLKSCRVQHQGGAQAPRSASRASRTCTASASARAYGGRREVRQRLQHRVRRKQSRDQIIGSEEGRLHRRMPRG